MTESRYPADTAANVVLAIAIVTAAILGIAGYNSLRAGEGLGWLMLGLALAAVLGAFAVRRWLRSSASR